MFRINCVPPVVSLLCLMVQFVFGVQDGSSQPGLDIAEADPKKASLLEGQLISHSRQLTFAGRRAGEGYFSADGKQVVFQSERDPSNPFYQIYLMDLETGDINKVSPGHGKTTCAWIHPSGKKIL
ncbi:MAG: peptidase M28, partial [Planctomycetota bacterium]|nr:peptidase M28 [Planctomycetota bacterium]